MPYTQLKSLLGDGNYLDNPSDIEPYLTPWRGQYNGATNNAVMVAFPSSVEQISSIVTHCAMHNIPIIPQGGNTGLVYGCLPSSDGNSVIINLSRMSNIRSLNITDNSAIVEAGCVLESLQNAAKDKNRLFPLSMASEGSAEIGGIIATNAGGTSVLKYGNMRDLVLGLEVVLPDGRIMSDLRPLHKNNAGYDLKHLFIGSEGTLGIITAATLKLFPLPIQRSTAFLAVENINNALEIFTKLKEQMGDMIVAFELITSEAMQAVEEHIADHKSPFDAQHNCYLLIEIESCLSDFPLRQQFEDVLAKLWDKELVADAVLADSNIQAQKLWSLREHISEASRKSGIGLHYDIVVPISQVASFINTTNALIKSSISEVRTIAFGHIGDGNIHYNQYFPHDVQDISKYQHQLDDIIYDSCIQHDGTITAEHGVGLDRQKAFYRYTDQTSIDLMTNIKQTLDPQGIMNKGKVIK